MTTAQIKLFITAANYLNFTEAANSLFVTPSYLSRQISSLEQELGLLLFIRGKRAVQLTPAGRALLEDLSLVYDQYTAAVKRAQGIQQGLYTTLKIGVLDGHTLDSQFPAVTGKMNRLYPNVQISLFHASFSALCTMLDTGKADMIITLGFSLEGRSQTDRIVLSRTREYLMVPKNSPLAGKPRITAQDLSGMTMISISREDCPYAADLSLGAQHNTGMYIKEAPDLETCALWIQAGIGIGIVNSHNLLASDMSICAIDLDDVDIDSMAPTDTELVLAWNRDNANPALTSFVDICQDDMIIGKPPVPLNLRQKPG